MFGMKRHIFIIKFGIDLISIYTVTSYKTKRFTF